jgi:heavy metal translocating P-type ATPase
MQGVCDHCGLPLLRPWWASARPRAVNAGPAYCCLGCRLAASILRERTAEGAARGTLTRLGFAIFFSMNVMAFTMALWTSDVYQDAGGEGVAATLSALLRYLVMLFAIPVLFLLGWPLCENAIEAAKRRVFSTDLLLTAGVGASFVFSIVSVLRGHGPVYFEVGCVVLVMVTLGRWLEATGKIKANDALNRLGRLMPDRVRRVRDGVEELIEIGAVTEGDLLRVLAGERIPADGRIADGVAFVNEQVLTGESAPALRQAGNPVLGGTLNLDGNLLVEVTAAGDAGTLARLIALVERARLAQGWYARLADRVSAWFVPVVAVIALATLAIHSQRSGLERGVLQALAVILIACPCALGLATPLAVWSALGRAANAQVLFRSGEALERLARVRAVRFDKTGTLTTGEPIVALFRFGGREEPREVLACAGSLANASSHVMAKAIARYTEESIGATIRPAYQVRTIAGRGVAGFIASRAGCTEAFLGNRRLLEENGLTIDRTLAHAASEAETRAQSVSWLGWNGRARALFAFEELVRPSAAQALRRCEELTLNVGVLTGDHAARGAAVSRELAVEVVSGLLPDDKVAAIVRARQEYGPVAMVGDGVNDAPALASSDVGVSLGCGTDLSRETAAVCLLGDDLGRLPWAIDLARRTVSVIRGNLFWAFGYNTLGIACAAAGLLTPAIAALLMVGSSALVIVNSLRLRGEGASGVGGLVETTVRSAFPGDAAVAEVAA